MGEEENKNVEEAGKEEIGEEVKEQEIKEEEKIEWVPKTKLGNDIIAGKYKSIEEILQSGKKILEPEIVDYLVPDLKHEFIYIGGTPGKGGGIKRTPTRMTARMHKSGRRFKITALAVVGNENGIIGIGKSSSNEHRIAMEKALKQAKMNLIAVRRGCGSWECNCGGKHSIPFKSKGKMGSVRVTIMPAPKGTGIVAGDEAKKILRLAGIKDITTKVFGQTSVRINLAYAFFNALKNLSSTRGEL